MGCALVRACSPPVALLDFLCVSWDTTMKPARPLKCSCSPASAPPMQSRVARGSSAQQKQMHLGAGRAVHGVLVVSVQELLPRQVRRGRCLPPQLPPVPALALLVEPLAPRQHTPAAPHHNLCAAPSYAVHSRFGSTLEICSCRTNTSATAFSTHPVCTVLQTGRKGPLPNPGQHTGRHSC